MLKGTLGGLYSNLLLQAGSEMTLLSAHCQMGHFPVPWVTYTISAEVWGRNYGYLWLDVGCKMEVVGNHSTYIGEAHMYLFLWESLFELLGWGPGPTKFSLPVSHVSFIKLKSPAAHFTWHFMRSEGLHSRFLKTSAATPPRMLLSPNPQHCTHLYLARVQRWLSCHWQSCSSTSSLEIGVGIPGSQSLPLLLRWAWSPHSSDRSVAAWVPVLGCSHIG